MHQEAICKTEYTEISDTSLLPKSPVVSVNMMAYNHGPYLADAIEGVISQETDFPIELVIGEDCSIDNTREIALDYQRRYPNLIRVIYSDQNVGMMANGLRTLLACRGEFIAFCEGDDYWIDSGKLCEQVNVLSKLKNINIAFHSCYHEHDKTKEKTISHVYFSTDKILTLSEVIAGGGILMPTASLLIRRSLLVSVLDWFYTTMPPIGDYFLQVFGSKNGGAYYINKPMSIYRKEVETSWTERTEKSIDLVIEFEKKFFLALKKLEDAIHEQEEAFRHHMIYHYSCRLINIKNENLYKIKKLMTSILKYLYESKEITDKTIIDERLEWEYYLKFAIDVGKIKDLEDQKCGVVWQFLRVAKSLLEYETSILKKININITPSDSNSYERIIEKWRTEVYKIYLIARWKRLYRLIIGNLFTKKITHRQL